MWVYLDTHMCPCVHIFSISLSSCQYYILLIIIALQDVTKSDSSFAIFQNFFSYFGALNFPIYFIISLFKLYKGLIVIWNLDRDCTGSVDTLFGNLLPNNFKLSNLWSQYAFLFIYVFFNASLQYIPVLTVWVLPIYILFPRVSCVLLFGL